MSLATTASPADVFWLKEAGSDPVRFSKEDIDPDVTSGLLEMPECEKLAGWQIEIDLVRWAFQAWQDGVFPTTRWRTCVASCVGDEYCGDSEAILDCVEACARATCQHDDSCFVMLSSRWYNDVTSRCGP